MPTTVDAATDPPSHVKRPRRPRMSWVLLSLSVFIGTATGAWVMGYSPRRLTAMVRNFSTPTNTLATLPVDTGDIDLEIVESGTLESANSVPVKCQVKALLGTVNSAVGGMQQGGGGGRGGGGGGRGGQSSGGGAPPRMTGTAGQAQAKKGTTKGAAGTAKGAADTAKGAASGAGGMAGGAGGASSVLQAPMIRSFTYVVMPYIPLRGAAVTGARASTVSSSAMPVMGGGGGGGGGGGMQDRSGSTRILSILPEGTLVKQGEVVCELDSSNFINERAAQKIKWAQAKSWVDQARQMLAVNEIALEEYRDGILPQDSLLIQQYIASCKTQLQKAHDDLEYGRKLYAKGLKTASQVQADRFNFERAELSLQQANRMLLRLQKFTAPRLLTNLEAKLASIKSDVLAQEVSFSLEDQRLKDIERMIGFCVLRAPVDGVVVYANQANAWGRVDDQIRDGVAVREGQPIFSIPDSSRMRVKARVNESKVSEVTRGQKVEVVVDAYPDRPFEGRVAEVTAIPAPAAGPISDVKIYYAWVDIATKGFLDLRPGMSAEVRFDEGSHPEVTRLPVQAIRRVGSEAYVAVPSGKGHRWQAVELGASNSVFAEVRSGLKPGDRVAAEPWTLPPPPGAAQETARSLSGIAAPRS